MLPWLVCVAERGTLKALTPVYLVQAENIHKAVVELYKYITPEQRELLKSIYYADCLLYTEGLKPEEYDHIPWYYRYS
jgi:hypothetical protein